MCSNSQSFLCLLKCANYDFQIQIMCWHIIKRSYAKDHLDFVVKDTPAPLITTAGIGGGALRNSNTGSCHVENKSNNCNLQEKRTV